MGTVLDCVTRFNQLILLIVNVFVAVSLRELCEANGGVVCVNTTQGDWISPSWLGIVLGISCYILCTDNTWGFALRARGSVVKN